MSSTTKRKHVTQEALCAYSEPDDARQQSIVRVSVLAEKYLKPHHLSSVSASSRHDVIVHSFYRAITFALFTFTYQIVRPRGNNLHEVENAKGETYLASMPPKFRKIVWVKRGDHVIVEPIAEGDKVRAEIVHVIITREHRRFLQESGVWPFAEADAVDKPFAYTDGLDLPPSESESSDDDDERVSDESTANEADDSSRSEAAAVVTNEATDDS